MITDVDGLFYGGGADQLWRQVVGALAVLSASFIATYIIGFLIQTTMGFRIEEAEEAEGIDTVVHAESGYDFSALGGSGGSNSRHSPPVESASTFAVPSRTSEGTSA